MGRRYIKPGFPVVLIIFIAFFMSSAAAEDYLDYYEQGEFSLAVKKWSRAIELFSKSIEANPKFFMSYLNRAIAYSKLGDYDKSIEDLLKVVELNPDYSDAYSRLGLVYEIKKDYREALKYYQDAAARERKPEVNKIIQKYIQDVESKIKK